MSVKDTKSKNENYVKWNEPKLIKLSDPLAYGAVCSNGTGANTGCSNGSGPSGGTCGATGFGD